MRRRSPPSLEFDEARRAGFYNIGEAAAAADVSAKMIRYYESIELIPKAARTSANYRLYSENDVHVLRFIKRSRDLGFSTDQIKTLLGLWQGRSPSADVKRLALKHVEELEKRIRELDAMRRTLTHLADHCHGDDRPACPILDELAGADDAGAAEPAKRARHRQDGQANSSR